MSQHSPAAGSAATVCHREHSISFTQEPVGRNGGPYSKWEPCPEIAQAKEWCKRARWPEQHRDDCAWCALVAAESDLYSAVLDQGEAR